MSGCVSSGSSMAHSSAAWVSVGGAQKMVSEIDGGGGGLPNGFPARQASCACLFSVMMEESTEFIGPKLAPFNPSGEDAIRMAIEMLQVNAERNQDIWVLRRAPRKPNRYLLSAPAAPLCRC